jgi:hypothetical protein
MNQHQDRQGAVSSPDPGFAPEDFTDGRGLGQWRSRYDREAWSYIYWEAGYLAALLLIVLVSMLLVWLKIPQRYLKLSDAMSPTFTRYVMAGLSGILGGVLFAMKWLYHSVAKELWNVDRKLWRYFAPIISGGLAFAAICVTEAFGVFDPKLVATSARTTALGFMVGFFSDNALAKLAEVAQTLFGPTHKKTDSINRR